MERYHELGRDRRYGTQWVVRDLLAERQEMLVAFSRLIGLDPHTADQPVKPQLEEFCQLLMDYATYWHFELYRRIVAGGERRALVREVARGVYPTIATTTDWAVAFNEKYSVTRYSLDLAALTGDLHLLGESLASRLELENRLLEALIMPTRSSSSTHLPRQRTG